MAMLSANYRPEGVFPLDHPMAKGMGGGGANYNFYGDTFGYDELMERVLEAQDTGDRIGVQRVFSGNRASR